MTDFFPRRTVAITLEEERPAIRRLTHSLPEMALITGVAMRLWHSYVLTHGAPDSWAWVGGTFLAGLIFLCVMCTLHIGNYTLRNWVWRAPAFAVLEAGTEIVMSLALTAFGLEPLGSETAELADWLPTATRILIWRLTGIILFTAVLAVVVWVVRRLLLANEDRSSTLQRVHRASVEQQATPD